MEEQRVMVAGVILGAVELVVGGVLETDTCVEQRPAGRLADAEGDVGNLGREAVAVGGGNPPAKSRVQGGIRAAPDVEILAGEDDPVVAAVGERPLQLEGVYVVIQIGGTTV